MREHCDFSTGIRGKYAGKVDTTDIRRLGSTEHVERSPVASVANGNRGLDDRCRDLDGEIRHKRGDTLNTYENFSGSRPRWLLKIDEGRPCDYRRTTSRESSVARRSILMSCAGFWSGSPPDLRRGASRLWLSCLLSRNCGKLPVTSRGRWKRCRFCLDIMDNEVLGPVLRKGLRQGRLEGRVEGRVEGQVEILLSLIQKRFGRIPPAVAQ